MSLLHEVLFRLYFVISSLFFIFLYLERTLKEQTLTFYDLVPEDLTGSWKARASNGKIISGNLYCSLALSSATQLSVAQIHLLNAKCSKRLQWICSACNAMYPIRAYYVKRNGMQSRSNTTSEPSSTLHHQRKCEFVHLY